jgi:hypothetical protein
MSSLTAMFRPYDNLLVGIVQAMSGSHDLPTTRTSRARHGGMPFPGRLMRGLGASCAGDCGPERRSGSASPAPGRGPPGSESGDEDDRMGRSCGLHSEHLFAGTLVLITSDPGPVQDRRADVRAGCLRGVPGNARCVLLPYPIYSPKGASPVLERVLSSVRAVVEGRWPAEDGTGAQCLPDRIAVGSEYRPRRSGAQRSHPVRNRP